MTVQKAFFYANSETPLKLVLDLNINPDLGVINTHSILESIL